MGSRAAERPSVFRRYGGGGSSVGVHPASFTPAPSMTSWHRWTAGPVQTQRRGHQNRNLYSCCCPASCTHNSQKRAAAPMGAWAARRSRTTIYTLVPCLLSGCMATPATGRLLCASVDAQVESQHAPMAGRAPGMLATSTRPRLPSANCGRPGCTMWLRDRVRMRASSASRCAL